VTVEQCFRKNTIHSPWGNAEIIEKYLAIESSARRQHCVLI